MVQPPILLAHDRYDGYSTFYGEMESFLNGSRVGVSSLCRVPSANMNKDVRRAFMPSPATCNDLCAFALFPLSTKTVPDSLINGPSTGFHCIDFLAMMDACLGNILGKEIALLA